MTQAKKILVTGAAGFIGMHIASELLRLGYQVLGIDNLNDYYDVDLKRARLDQLVPNARFEFSKLDIADRTSMEQLFASNRFERVIHLAAQAGVRYSLKDPHAYAASNLVGFLNVLEGCRANEIEHLVFASSSSVYGANAQVPFSVHHNTDHPVSLYAATKKANEVMAHAYSHLYKLPVTGLRFFTVYGPWGRPDMAVFLFTEAILEGRPIAVYNNGDMWRDFTYIDDIVKGVVRAMDVVPAPDPHWSSEKPDPATSSAPYRIYNIGNHQPVKLLDFIHTLEKALGKKAIRNFLPMQPGDVPVTCADIEDLHAATGFAPATRLQDGIANWIAWFNDYAPKSKHRMH